MNRFDNIDCMVGMAEYPDKYFDLAIVDPPYGIKGGINDNRKTVNPSKRNSMRNFGLAEWDCNPPDKNYFNELKRVSRNQIIWGANYFPLFEYRCFIVWDKQTFIPSMSRVELAYTSFNEPARLVVENSNQIGRIHINQKPIALYKWLLTKYAKPNNKILDTHVGSASSLIACEDLGFEYVGFELDKDYYLKAQKRLEQFRSQLKLAI